MIIDSKYIKKGLILKKVFYLCFRFKVFKYKIGRNLSFCNLSDFILCKFLKWLWFFKWKIDYDMIVLE